MTHGLATGDLYHTGLAVPDVEESAARLSAAAGYHWTRLQEVEIPVWLPTGVRTIRLRYVYSIESPTLELVESVPGTPWEAPAGGTLHHLGFFADDLPTAVKRLVAEGYELEAHALLNGELGIFAYVLDPAGTRIELIDRAVIPDLEAYKRERAA